MNKRHIGQVGEKLAYNFLKKKGFHILETNFRCKEGEIDIIAENKKCIIFIEVRTKTSMDFGAPEESITGVKKNHLIHSAYKYLNLYHKENSAWRIDFVAIVLNRESKIIRIEHIENAVSK